VESRCQNCGEPATREQGGRLVCEDCACRFDEYDRNREAADAGLIQWTLSRHDPFWRGWLTSWELFAAVRETAPRVGKCIHTVAGGEVFECLRGAIDCWLQVWLTDTEVLVAYPPAGKLYGWPDHPDGPHQFEEWAGHLRGSPPLELGRVRDRCSYGAVFGGAGVSPVVKWAQAGDWSAAARTWHIGPGRPLAPWP
jgi:hypothetical protein